MNIHRMAIVAPDVRLGANVRIGPYAVIEEDVVIGDDCQIAAHAVIKRHTRLGARNRIAEHAVIGGEPQDFKFRPECLSYTVIGNDNRLREGVTVHRGSREGSATKIGNHCFLMVDCHVAHDCILEDHVIIANYTALAGEVVVEQRAFVSGLVSVHQFCRIGRNAMISQSTRLTQDALPFFITEGSPSRARGLNLVGLKRNGFARETLAALKEAYRLLASNTPLAEALARLDAMPDPAVQHLARFIAASKRGFTHPGR